MNIIQAHKFYWHRDGASNYMLYLSELLEKEGHTVIPFAMQQKESLETEYSKYFVSESKLDDPKKVNLANKIKFAGRMFYSFEAKKKMSALLKVKKIDLVHLHNIYHHISPSILPIIKKAGIPIVMTLHDYKLICPNYTMFHHGEIHEEDCRGLYGSCVRKKCMKDSFSQSFIIHLEMIFHHKIMRYYERLVDKFIAPSEFIKNKCVEFGWPEEKFVHIPHPIDIDKFKPGSIDKGYVAYIGRLSEEKGLEVLIQAAKKLPKIPFKIVGTGPLYEPLKKNTKNISNIEFTGFKTGKELEKIYSEARILVVPSIWYENYPLSVLEPKAFAKVVLGSDIGGIPELLPKDLLFTPKKVSELTERIEYWFNKSSAELKKTGEKLRAQVEKDNDPGVHVERVLELYTTLVNSK